MDLNTNPQEQIPVMTKPEQLADNVNTGVYEAPAPAMQSVDSTPHTVAEAEAAIAAIEEPKTKEQMFAEHLYKIAISDKLYSSLPVSKQKLFVDKFHKKVIEDFFNNHSDQTKNIQTITEDWMNFFESEFGDEDHPEISKFFLAQDIANSLDIIIKTLEKNS